MKMKSKDTKKDAPAYGKSAGKKPMVFAEMMKFKGAKKTKKPKK